MTWAPLRKMGRAREKYVQTGPVGFHFDNVWVATSSCPKALAGDVIIRSIAYEGSIASSRAPVRSEARRPED